MAYDCCVAPGSSQARSIRVGFRTTAIIGLLIGIITVFWQIRSHADMNQFDTDWSFELEICFGIYGFFLASTSYYLGEIHASSWAKFHIIVSAIGIVLDLVLFGHHATSVIKIDSHLAGGLSNIGNDHFMISIATVQAANNSVAIFLCRKLLGHKNGIRKITSLNSLPDQLNKDFRQEFPIRTPHRNLRQSLTMARKRVLCCSKNRSRNILLSNCFSSNVCVVHCKYQNRIITADICEKCLYFLRDELSIQENVNVTCNRVTRWYPKAQISDELNRGELPE